MQVNTPKILLTGSLCPETTPSGKNEIGTTAMYVTMREWLIFTYHTIIYVALLFKNKKWDYILEDLINWDLNLSPVLERFC